MKTANWEKFASCRITCLWMRGPKLCGLYQIRASSQNTLKDDSRHFKAEQEFCGAIECFGLTTPENPGTIRLLHCEPAYPCVAYRCLLAGESNQGDRWLNRVQLH